MKGRLGSSDTLETGRYKDTVDWNGPFSKGF